ncbi:hypothetical protein [Sphaerisporangium rhizosphaerae]|uniref:YqaJ viral recombinase domain-containing protein n=1 Tax=Sphaerisporangium rhizosphaerae TaxID=2269375 RepID=A0ABW2PFM2_9ACTN
MTSHDRKAEPGRRRKPSKAGSEPSSAREEKRRLKAIAERTRRRGRDILDVFTAVEHRQDRLDMKAEFGEEHAGGHEVVSRYWPGNRREPDQAAAGRFVHSYAREIILGTLNWAPPGSKERADLARTFALTWPADVVPNEGPGRMVITLPDGTRRIPDGVATEKGIMVELKPKGSERTGRRQARLYAAYADLHYPLGEGRKWKWMVVTYDNRAAVEKLVAMGYLPPAKRSWRGQRAAGLKAYGETGFRAVQSEPAAPEKRAAAEKPPLAQEPPATQKPPATREPAATGKPPAAEKPVAPSPTVTVEHPASRPAEYARQRGLDGIAESARGPVGAVEGVGRAWQSRNIGVMQNEELAKAARSVARLQPEIDRRRAEGDWVVVVAVFDEPSIFDFFARLIDWREERDVKRFVTSYLRYGPTKEDAYANRGAPAHAAISADEPSARYKPPTPLPEKRPGRRWVEAEWDVLPPHPVVRPFQPTVRDVTGRWRTVVDGQEAVLDLDAGSGQVRADLRWPGRHVQVERAAWEPETRTLRMVVSDGGRTWIRSCTFRFIGPDLLAGSFTAHGPAAPDRGTGVSGITGWWRQGTPLAGTGGLTGPNGPRP